MSEREKVIKILNEEKPYLRRKFGVQRIGLFGSIVKGGIRKKSDIDIFVQLERPVGFAFFDCIDYLEKKLKRKADVITSEGIRGIRVKRIAQDIKRSLIYV